LSYISDEILMQVEKPSRYTGGEWNSVIKNKEEVDIRFGFCFPDVYDIAMSHLGIKILYQLLNERADTWCERVFAPWPDLEGHMRKNHLKLFGLESQEAITNFDFIGFTLQYEMSYTNIINMLDLAGVPVFSKDRTGTMPFVIAGGPAGINPEPLADFVDLYNLGDGEEMLPEVMDVYIMWKKSGEPRIEFLKMAAKIDGVYVPAFYETTYNEDGTIKSFAIKEEAKGYGAKAVIQKRIVKDLDTAYFPDKMVVPFTSVVHDRIMMEIFRGCSRGCRFCQAGFIYRPVRERSVDTLVNIAEKLVNSTGYEEISMLSLSTSDYSSLIELTDKLLEKVEAKKVNLGLPSLRVDTFSLELMEKAQKVRKSGLTFAPEAGSQRLRDVINKGITEEDLLRSAELAFKGGWNSIKLYFMLGLPTETDEDILGIVDLAKKVLEVYDRVGNRARKPEITVSASTFVPKPFTPFQWVPQLSKDEIIRRQQLLKNALPRKISYGWHDPQTSLLEATLSRGDRRIGQVLYKVWQKGAKFDSWSEYMKFDRWMEAFADCGLRADFYNSRERSLDEILPWDHVDIGVTRKFLENEYKKALAGELTPNCMVKCSGCGVTVYGGGICVDNI